MSKIGKINISIPEKVKVVLSGNMLNIEGPLGKKSINIDLEIFNLDINDGKEISIKPKKLDQNIKRGRKVEIEINGEISKVSLISTGSTTHAQGSESKFRNINFNKISNNKIEIKLDNNPNDLQNGTYLLFVLNSKGSPSEGKIVFVS